MKDITIKEISDEQVKWVLDTLHREYGDGVQVIDDTGTDAKTYVMVTTQEYNDLVASKETLTQIEGSTTGEVSN